MNTATTGHTGRVADRLKRRSKISRLPAYLGGSQERLQGANGACAAVGPQPADPAGPEAGQGPAGDAPGTVLAVVPAGHAAALAAVGYLLNPQKSGCGAAKFWPPHEGLVVDRDGRDAVVDGAAAGLTFQEFELLDFLTSNAGRVFSRAQLLEFVWGHSHAGLTRTVDVHIHRLRRKLGPGYGQCLVTVRRVGYRFTALPAGDR